VKRDRPFLADHPEIERNAVRSATHRFATPAGDVLVRGIDGRDRLLHRGHAPR